MAGDEAKTDAGVTGSRPRTALPVLTLSELLDTAPPEGTAVLRQPARQPRARVTVDRIFLAARAVILRDGIGGLNIADLIQQASITEPTFYRYFTGIDHLMQEAVRRFATRRVRDWQTLLETHDFTSLAQLADLLAELGTRHLMAIPGMPAPMLRRFLPHIDSMMPQLVPPIRMTIQAGMRRGGMKEAASINTELFDAVLISMMRMATSLAAADPALLHSARARHIAAAMLLAGLQGAVAMQEESTSY